MEGESERAWQAFQLYLSLGADRSLTLVERIWADQSPTNRSGKNGRVTTWSSRWRWRARAGAFEAYYAALQAQDKEEQAKRDASVWAARQAVIREHAWEDYLRTRTALAETLRTEMRPADRARALKELTIALAKVGEVAARMGVGVSHGTGEQAPNALPPEGAAKFEVWLAQQPSE